MYTRYNTVDINVAIATGSGVVMAPIIYSADEKVVFLFYLDFNDFLLALGCLNYQ